MDLNLKQIPSKPGVYKFKDNIGNVIYVGASKNLSKRVSSYFRLTTDHPRLTKLIESINQIDFEIISSANTAFLRERELIDLHKPIYNVRWLDDKQYPYLTITTSEKYPRIAIVRHEKEDNNKYFSKQASVGPLRESIKHIRKIFPICDCKTPVKSKIKKRPCLNFDLGLCSAPCAKKIDVNDYNKTVSQLIEFLDGKSSTLLDKWKSEMNTAALNLNYEYAANLRNRISTVQKLSDQDFMDKPEHSFDVIGYIQAENATALIVLTIAHQKVIDQQEYILENKEYVTLDDFLLSGLKSHYQTTQQLPNLILLPISLNEVDFLFEWLNSRASNPIKFQIFSNSADNKWLKLASDAAKKSISRNIDSHTIRHPYYQDIEKYLIELLNVRRKNISLIECIDISTLQGTNTVGSIVASKNGVLFKKYYRRYKVKGFDRPNDPGSMKEVLVRHFNRKKKDKSEYPDLLLIDGGKSQLSAVKEVIDALNLDIPYLGLAKRREEIYLPKLKNPIQLSHTSETLRLLVLLRNEAHRFAITFHRHRRNITSLESELETIKGLGPQTRKTLLRHFGSLKNIEIADTNELINVKGVNNKLAKDIISFFSSKRIKS